MFNEFLRFAGAHDTPQILDECIASSRAGSQESVISRQPTPRLTMQVIDDQPPAPAQRVERPPDLMPVSAKTRIIEEMRLQGLTRTYII